jgi:hypothetical protein
MQLLAEPVYADAMREASDTLDRELSGRGDGTSNPTQ